MRGVAAPAVDWSPEPGSVEVSALVHMCVGFGGTSSAGTSMEGLVAIGSSSAYAGATVAAPQPNAKTPASMKEMTEL